MHRWFTVGLVTLLLHTTAAAQPPYGETLVAGTTFADIQHFSTTGKMIACDSLGGIHLTWAFADDQHRDVCYNFYSMSEYHGWVFGINNHDIVNNSPSAYAPSLTIMSDQQSMVFYTCPQGAVSSNDFERGFGAFESYVFRWPDDTTRPVLEPKGCIDSSSYIYLAGMTPIEGDENSYVGGLWFATCRDVHWPSHWQVGRPIIFDTTAIPSQIMTYSQATGKVALVWHKNLVGFPVPEQWNNSHEFPMNNDIHVAIRNGANWRFDNTSNITRTILPRPILLGEGAYGDTLRPYPDLDAIWVGDVLHVVFTARGFWSDPNGAGTPPVERVTQAESFIWHWDSASDTLMLVANGWYENGFSSGFNSANVSKPSLGADSEGRLYCVFRQAFPEDLWSESCAGDIMVTRSSDGIEWSTPVNVTNTHPDGDQIAPWDEIYPSLAERVNDTLHISYLRGWTGREHPEEDPRLMEVVYHRIPVADLPDFGRLELPRENFQYHNREALAVSEPPNSPSGFALTSAFPNPFNSETRISFNLGREQTISLSITDLGGREVARLANGKYNRGVSALHWNAVGVPAGIYLVRLQGESTVRTVKIVLLK